jgi:hypothetical protein
MAPARPSHKELSARIADARDAFKKKRVVAVNAGKFATQLVELGISGQAELLGIVSELLGQIAPSAYAGQRPPARCTEQGFETREMWAFVVESRILGMRVYFKFVVENGLLGLVSLHETTEGS